MPNHTHICTGDSISVSPGHRLYAKVKGPNLGDFNFMYHNAILRATKEAYEALPTLNVLLANIERENLVRIRNRIIAKTLNVSEVTVDRHIKKLRQCQIIIPDAAELDRTRAVFNWRVCPFLGWRGKTEALDAYLKSLPDNHVWKEYNLPIENQN